MTTRTIPKESDLHKKLLAMIGARVKMSRSAHQTQCEEWSKAEDRVLAYVAPTASDTIRSTKRDQGEPQYTTISIPYTYAQVMAAHTYWTSVFFARTPVHQYSGRHGEGENQVLAMEALIDYQVQVGAMLGPYYLWFYDAGKYGVGILGTYWEENVIQYGQLVEQVDPATGQRQLIQITNRVPGYKGNCAYNISPFDFVHDPRVPIGQFQKGEFCYCKKKISWNDVVKWRAQGHFMNVEFIKGSMAGVAETREESTSSLVRPDQTTRSDHHELTDIEGKTHPAIVYAYEFHVELIQKDWGLGESTYPEKWVFTVTQDLSLIIGARPLGAIHGMFPFDVLEPEVEAYAAYNRGIPAIMEPMQDTMDWLLNSHMFNVRAALNNQFIGDPSRIMVKDIENSGQPGFFFRLRPEAYGQDVRTMLQQLPVQDVTRAHMADLDSMFGIGERVLGINDQILGALTGGGGRKTATEVRTSTGFGVNRLKTISEYMSATGFSQHSQKLVQTSQQYYDAALKLKIVGDSAAMAPMRFWQVTPDMIAGSFDFVSVDGTLPVDRLAQANLLKEVLLSVRYLPFIGQQYDLSRIFAYTAQVAGIKNINQFKVQVRPDAMLQQEAQAGNVVPMRPGGAGQVGGQQGAPNSATESGLNAMQGGY